MAQEPHAVLFYRIACCCSYVNPDQPRFYAALFFLIEIMHSPKSPMAPFSSAKTVWIGLTGGMASGKSTVSALFKEAGAFIIDADPIAHDLLKKGYPAYTPVLNFFGPGILDTTGEIDRKALGQIVFRAEEKRIALNQIIHPFIFEIAGQEHEQIARQHPHAVIIFDAPLLIETGVHTRMDMVIVVYLDWSAQIQRLMDRDQCSREEAERRIGLQIPLDEKIRLAHEVIDNRKNLSDVRKNVEEIYRCLVRVGEGFTYPLSA